MSWKFSVRRSPRVDLLVHGRGRRLGALLDLDHVLVVGLVGELLEVAGRGHDDAGVVADARRVDHRHRRREVDDVVALHVLFAELHAGEVDDHAVAFLAQAGGRRGIRELHDDAAGAFRRAAEIDAA